MPSEQLLEQKAKAALRGLLNTSIPERERVLLSMATGTTLTTQQQRLALRVLDGYMSGEFTDLCQAIVCIARQ